MQLMSSITHGPFSLSLQTITTWDVLHSSMVSSLSFPTSSWLLTFLAAPLAAPSSEGLLLQDNAVSAEIRALLSSYYNDR